MIWRSKSVYFMSVIELLYGRAAMQCMQERGANLHIKTYFAFVEMQLSLYMNIAAEKKVSSPFGIAPIPNPFFSIMYYLRSAKEKITPLNTYLVD